MRDTTMKKLLKTMAVGLLAGSMGLVGCADPELIDRVQPNVIKKADLTTGEWYALSTVTRAPYASHRAFPGRQGTLERGIWEVERDHLYFYRTYEFVEGVEQQGIKADSDTPLLDEQGNPVTYEKVMPDGTVRTVTRYVYRSTPLKRYAITGHFDIRRQYNPLTGEESNVLVEDTSEKFWYQRQHMRVNFAANSAFNFADPSFGLADAIFEGDTGPEDIKLRVEDDGAYMDFVIRGFVEAPRTWFGSWGWIPTCLFFPWYTGAYFECDEEEIHLRSSFMRVEENNSYEPMAYNDHMMNKFGYFRADRAKHDRFFGQTFSAAIRHARRFRIWDEYVTGADGSLDYAAMAPRPIVYYLSENFPRELVPGAIDLADQWNEPFLEVVEARTGRAFDGRMFVLCENSTAEVDAVLAANPNALVASTDPRYCRDMDRPKRIGDLRYHQLVSINDPVQYGLYGYGPMNTDPITGEIIQANSFQYTANLRRGARRAVDMLEYAAGVQTFRDISQARHIDTSTRAKALEGTAGDPRPRAIGGLNGAPLSDAQAMASMVMAPEIAAEISQVGFDVVDTDIAAARMSRLLRTDRFDHLWMNADMAAIVGLPVTDLHQDLSTVPGANFLSDMVHPTRLGSEPMLKWHLERDMDRGMNAICMGTHFDDSIRGLALEYKGAYDAAVCDGIRAQMDAGADYVFDFNAFLEPGARCDGNPGACRADQTCQFLDQGEVSGSFCMTPCSAGAMLQQLRREIRRVNQISQFVYWDPNALFTDTRDARVSASQIAAREIIEARREQVFLEIFDRMWSTVAMHEVGHNVGLRHNFESSTDALNYFPEYWDMKGRDVGGAWEPYTLWTHDTESQVVNRMREFQQTSIMEYTSAFNARFMGLGSYDRAAILFAYGDLVEVFEQPPAFPTWEPYLADPADEDPTLFSVQQRREAPLARALRKIHHTNIPNLFGGVGQVLDRRLVDVHEPADLGKPCSQHDNPYDWSVCGTPGSFCQPFPAGFFCTRPDVVEVPYRFCSDEYNWSTPTCQTWDEGTDTFEIINNHLADYEAYWPFIAYKRDNDLFSPMTGYWMRTLMNFYGWRKHFEHWILDYARYNKDDWWEQRFGTPWHEDVNGGLGSTLAMMQLFEKLASIFGRPNDSYYGFNEQRQYYEPLVDNGRNTYCNVFQIREDQGARPMYPSYDFSGYIYTPARAGTFYDRMAAMMFMTYPTSMFTVGVDRTYDMRRFRMSFASAWPQRMQNIFAGILAGNPDLYGWCIEHDSGTTPPNQGICSVGPVRVKPRIWFGTPHELDEWYANCKPLNPEPEYSFPTTQYRLPALAAIYGYSWLSSTFDRSFIDRNRLWMKGDGTDIVIPPSFETIEYTDPFSGKTYVAAYDPMEEDPTIPVTPRGAIPDSDFEGQKHVYWSAARLVALAKSDLAAFGGNLSQVSANYQYSRLQQTVGRLEILRGLYRLFDFGF